MSIRKFLCFLLLLVCSSNVFAFKDHLGNRDGHASMVRVVATPDIFDGEVVQIYGALRVFSDRGVVRSAIICIDSESAKKRIWPNCALVNLSASFQYTKKMDGKYVLIDAIFSRSGNVVDMYIGSFDKVSRIEVIERP